VYDCGTLFTSTASYDVYVVITTRDADHDNTGGGKEQLELTVNSQYRTATPEDDMVHGRVLHTVSIRLPPKE